jgi:hypothetical protein
MAWQCAAKAGADADLEWDEASAWWHAAEALTKDRTARDAAAATLRRAHELAMDLQAAPLLTEVRRWRSVPECHWLRSTKASRPKPKPTRSHSPRTGDPRPHRCRAVIGHDPG